MKYWILFILCLLALGRPGADAVPTEPPSGQPSGIPSSTPTICNVEFSEYLGDGFCDHGGPSIAERSYGLDVSKYNSEECGWDGGDCCPESCPPGLMGCGENDYICKDHTYKGRASVPLCELANSTDVRSALEIAYQGDVGWLCGADDLPTTPVCKWLGASCDTNFSVDTLILENLGIMGRIPDSLGNLSALYALALNDNALTGTLPSAAMQPVLRYLFLANNSFSGTLPPNIGQTALEIVDISGNSFSGVLPRELADATNLLHLVISSNAFSGEIPSELGALPSLEILDMTDNQLSGMIPHELFVSESIRGLGLAHNRLHGEIPHPMFMPAMQYLSLNDNRLSGPLLAFNNESELTSLAEMRVQKNFLTGAPPTETGGAKLVFDPQLRFPLPWVGGSPDVFLEHSPIEVIGLKTDNLINVFALRASIISSSVVTPGDAVVADNTAEAQTATARSFIFAREDDGDTLFVGVRVSMTGSIVTATAWAAGRSTGALTGSAMTINSGFASRVETILATCYFCSGHGLKGLLLSTDDFGFYYVPDKDSYLLPTPSGRAVEPSLSSLTLEGITPVLAIMQSPDVTNIDHVAIHPLTGSYVLYLIRLMNQIVLFTMLSNYSGCFYGPAQGVYIWISGQCSAGSDHHQNDFRCDLCQL